MMRRFQIWHQNLNRKKFDPPFGQKNCRKLTNTGILPFFESIFCKYFYPERGANCMVCQYAAPTLSIILVVQQRLAQVAIKPFNRIEHSEISAASPAKNMGVQQITCAERGTKLHGVTGYGAAPLSVIRQHDRHSCKTAFNTLNSARVPRRKPESAADRKARAGCNYTAVLQLMAPHLCPWLQLFLVDRQRCQSLTMTQKSAIFP